MLFITSQNFSKKNLLYIYIYCGQNPGGTDIAQMVNNIFC